MSVVRVFHVVGLLLLFVGLSMLVAFGVSLFYRDGDSLGILLSAAVTFGAGLFLYLTTHLKDDITSREGYAIVTLAWVAAGAFGALPYFLTGTVDTPVQAFFEAVSGFTTTGATVMTQIEALPHGVLFWRSFTHWLGGMGIIVLAIAILPFLGVGGMQLFKAEVPGPTPERLGPRIAQTAKFLWFVYVGLTAIQSVLYLLGGMSLFDAVTHAFSTLATGGFSTRDASIAAFDSPYIHYVTIVFMYLAGVNFALHFRAAVGRPLYWKDPEWRFFTAVMAGAAVVVMGLNLLGGAYPVTGAGIEEAFRDGLFQTLAIGTTTGFVTANYELWIPGGHGVILALFFLGGMAGSTGGGIKAVRVMLVLKHTTNELMKHIHPRAILLARVGRTAVKEEVLANVVAFVILYLLLVLLGGLVMTLFGMDLVTAFGASAATVGNIGPGWGHVGPVENYGWISDGALTVLTFLMIVGRLEIYTVLVLLSPEMWRTGKGRHRVR